jgi:VWFA-related protein
VRQSVIPALLSALVLAASPAPAAQQVPGDREHGAAVPTFPAAAELVQIDVVVTGKDGAPVRDLRREDFQILEDGRPQAISHFAVGSASRPAAAPGTPATAATPPSAADPSASVPAVGRTIVLVFDDLHLGASRLSAAKREAIRFLLERVGPRDQVALVTTSGIRGVSQPLTRDRSALVRAVDRVTVQDRGARLRFGSPYISEQQAEQIDRFGELASAGNEAFELAVAQFVAEFVVRPEVAIVMVRERVRNILDEGARYTRAALSMLETTVRSLAPVPGRKVVVLLSEGFFLGRGTLSESAYDVRRITDAATRSGTVIYSIDAGGLSLPAPGGEITEKFLGAPSVAVRARVESGQDENRREGMRAVAEETGGFAVLDDNDIGSGLKRILDDNEVYYLLAYEPVSPRRAGRFRSINVRLPARPNLAARTRRGYFEPRGTPSATKPKEPSAKRAAAAAQARVQDAFVSIVPLRGLPVHLAADFIDLPDAGPTVVVNVAVDVAALRRSEVRGRDPGGVEVVGLVSDREGGAVESFAERLHLEVRPQTGDSEREDGVAVSRWFALKPGVYQVRVAALGEGSDETGSASEWIDVPDLAAGQLALSSLFLEPARGDGAEPGEGGSPGTREGGRAARARRSRFTAGSDLDVVLFAYNARTNAVGATDLAVRFELRSEGRLIHEFLPRPVRSSEGGSAQRVPTGARLSLAGLAPGEYELKAAVEDRILPATAERSALFTVE